MEVRLAVGIKYPTFAAWVAKRKREGRGDTPAKAEAASVAKVRWLEAVIDQAQEPNGKSSVGLTVHFAGGARTEFANAQQAELAATLLRALNQPSAGC